MEYLTLSWRSLHTTIYHLSEKIKKANQHYDLIVAVARGGLTVSHILSDFINLHITTFTVSTYKDFKQQTIPEITLRLGDKLHNKSILLVDDVSDHGKTFKRGIEYLKELGAEKITTASPYIKTWTKHVPDFYMKATDKWIIFPFDMKESVGILSKNYAKEGMSSSQIKRKLVQIKIPKYFVEKFVK
ncbi:hypothetical protein HZC27_05785 [Candidatus Roizmanbacteria bacterium]|nr:hypothetical protein [Candidatus Roizmanbacteria bacterium]